MTLDKVQLMEEFSKFIDATDQENHEEEKLIDLFSLFSELAALKAEVKLESRQIKRAVDEFKKIFDLLESNNRLLQKQLSEALDTKVAQQKDILRPLLLDFLEIHDRLSHNISMMTQVPKNRLILWWKKQQRKMIVRWREGFMIVLKVIKQRLSDYEVTVIKAVGQPLDPTRMQVRNIVNDSSQTDGIVLEELRQGYCWRGSVLRHAEVSINKREEKNE